MMTNLTLALKNKDYMAFDDATLLQIAALLAESSNKIQTWAFIQSCLNELVEAHEEGLTEQIAQQEQDDLFY
jgi:hypothetical protein